MADTSEEHLRFLRLALDEARKCVPKQTAFSVGCVLVVRSHIDHGEPIVLATGYSRELPGNTHAEANALHKALSLSSETITALFPDVTPPPAIDEVLAHVDVYTTMEPCSVRTSGLSPCANALIAAKIRRCVIGIGEPDDFVKCEGAQLLKGAGVEVVWVQGLEKDCLEIARRGHGIAEESQE